MKRNNYITNHLISTTDSYNHILENVVEEASIIGRQDGIEWASTENFSIQKYNITIENIGEIELNEYENIKNAFENKGECNKEGGIRLNNIKYYIINYDIDNNSLYLKKQGGGAVIDMTNLTFIIGNFSIEKKMKKYGD